MIGRRRKAEERLLKLVSGKATDDRIVHLEFTHFYWIFLVGHLREGGEEGCLERGERREERDHSLFTVLRDRDGEPLTTRESLLLQTPNMAVTDSERF